MLDEDPRKFMISLIQRNCNIIRYEGIIFVALGLFVLIAPVCFSLALEFFIGSVALIAAAILGHRIYKSEELPNKSSTIMNFLSYLLLGLVLLMYPLSGVVTLNLILASFFIFDGIFKLTSSIQMRPAPGWGWLFFNAFLSFLLSMLIVMQWPTGSAWILGILIGVSLLCTGLAELTLLWRLPKE